MADSLSVAHEHRESFRVFYSAATKYIPKNDKICIAKFNRFKHSIEQPLLQLAADKLTSIFGDAYMNSIGIDFDFLTSSPNGNSGGTDFIFDDNPEIAFQINFNDNLKSLYKKDLRLFCLTLSSF